MAEREYATQLFRVRRVDDPEVEYSGSFPSSEQFDHERRWVENRDLIRTIGGSGEGSTDAWKVRTEDAKKIEKRFGVEEGERAR